MKKGWISAFIVTNKLLVKSVPKVSAKFFNTATWQVEDDRINWYYMSQASWFRLSLYDINKFTIESEIWMAVPGASICTNRWLSRPAIKCFSKKYSSVLMFAVPFLIMGIMCLSIFFLDYRLGFIGLKEGKFF